MIRPSESVEDTDLKRLEDDVKSYLATLKRSMKERNLKIFMEKLSGKFSILLSSWIELIVILNDCICVYYFSDDLLNSMDSNMLRILAMQRIQELILNPESRTLTIFPYPGLFSQNNSTHTNVNQPWLQSNHTSENGTLFY